MLSNRSVSSATALAALVFATALPSPAQQANRQKIWKDNAEYTLAVSAARDTDPAIKLADLDKWASSYPATQWVDERTDLYLSAYRQSNQSRQAFDTAQMILQNHPDNYRALEATVSEVAAIRPSSAELDTAERAANYLLANVETVFEESNRPLGMSVSEWAQAKEAIAPLAQQALQTIRGLR